MSRNAPVLAFSRCVTSKKRLRGRLVPNCWQIFLELNSLGLYWSSRKENESRCLVFTSSIKREIKQIHVLRWCYTSRFATTIFSPKQRCNIVAILFRMVATLFSNIARLCCAKNRRCVSSRVTSPFSRAVTSKKCTKKRDARAKLFSLPISSDCIFPVFVALAFVVA